MSRRPQAWIPVSKYSTIPAAVFTHSPCSHIDSARMYYNEAQVGEAVRESGIPREQVFISELVSFGASRC